MTVAALAAELGVRQSQLKDWCRKKRFGKVQPVKTRTERAGTTYRQDNRNRVLNDAEVDKVRRELLPRLRLPTIEELSAALGEPCFPLAEAEKALGLAKITVERHAKRLGVRIQIRNGLAPSYAISATNLGRIWIEHEERVAGNREQGLTNFRHANRRRQHELLQLEERDYFGRVRAWNIQPAVVRDPSLSSETGPVMATWQWFGFYPDVGEVDLDLSTKVWRRSKPREAVSLEELKVRHYGQDWI